MSETNRYPSEDVRQPEPPLPEGSGLTLEEYLAMQQAIGHPTRFRILRTLVANDESSAADLKAAVDVGLVDKRQRRTADSQGFTRIIARQRWGAASSSTASQS